jgi:Leucine-rich repeat (LRR) protein
MPGSYGTIPPELGLLTSMEYLLLSELSIIGSLPTELGQLAKLLLLRMDTNMITGSIPDEFQSLTNLQVLNFVDNQLTGKIPTWIGDSWSSKLELLGLSQNRLEGTIPTSLAKMNNLLVLALDKNYNLTGDTVPISRLTNLELLYLQQNQFRHRITDIFLYQLTKLQVLDISDNLFSGEIPVHLMNHPALQIMDVSYNQLSKFPDMVQPNGDINLVHNNMTVDHTNLQFLALHNNQQISNIQIPTTLAYLTKLTHLDLTGLQFTGTMPEWLGNEVTTLSYLFLADMPTLTPGSIPESFQRLQNLVDISLQNSSRTGPIPLWVEDWDRVQLLDLSDNALTGELPWTVTDMISLRFLLLHKNRLNGTISEDFTSGTKLFGTCNNDDCNNGTSHPSSPFGYFVFLLGIFPHGLILMFLIS